jgi:hypothetical protein
MNASTKEIVQQLSANLMIAIIEIKALRSYIQEIHPSAIRRIDELSAEHHAEIMAEMDDAVEIPKGMTLHVEK